MNGGKGHPAAVDLFHRQFDRFRDIKKFEIEHNLVTTIDQPIDRLKPTGHEKLQTDFIKSGVGFALLDHFLRCRHRVNIKGDDDPLAQRNCFVVDLVPFLIADDRLIVPAAF